jgi:hypothetical protein
MKKQLRRLQQMKKLPLKSEDVLRLIALIAQLALSLSHPLLMSSSLVFATCTMFRKRLWKQPVRLLELAQR